MREEMSEVLCGEFDWCDAVLAKFIQLCCKLCSGCSSAIYIYCSIVREHLIYNLYMNTLPQRAWWSDSSERA